MKQSISIVIPVHNEEGNIIPLIDEIQIACKGLVEEFEILFINDSSTDNTLKLIKQSPFKNITVISNKKKLGQGRSVFLGIHQAKFESVVIIDGDRQYDASEIPKIVQLFKSPEIDFVCTRRSERKDDNLTKNLPSKAGNFLISILFKTSFSDIGSSLKIAYKKNLVKIPFIDNFHRYINIFLYHQNLNYVELPVQHKQRVYGKSNYSAFKFIQVILELRKVKKYLNLMIKELVK